MYDINVIANFFLSKESMTQKKLQKLCYYAQAYYLALYSKDLIDTDFEAWVHGPVSPALYSNYKRYGWGKIPKTTMEHYLPKKVYSYLNKTFIIFKNYSADELEDLTHEEDPWKNARIGLNPYESSNRSIDKNDIISYYSKKITKFNEKES